MKNRKIIIENSRGVELSCKLELPVDQTPKAYAIFAHCFTCNKNLNAVKNISRALTSKGFGVLRFDFTGLGQSGGDFSETDFSSNIQDLVDVADYMSREIDAPTLMIGHSLGGAAAIFASGEIDSINAVATIGAPSSPQHVQHLFSNGLAEIEKKGIAMVEIGGRPFPISKQFIEDISKKDMAQVVKSLRKPLLLLHSPQDTIVGVNNASEIYSAAMHPKSFVSLDGADHLLSVKEDSIYAGKVISEWASRYVKSAEKPQLETKYQVAVKIGSESLTTDIIAAGHSLTADEPESVGGNNFGPAPYDLLLSSLGACTVMTLRLYADRKKWDLKEVIIHLNHEKRIPKATEGTESNGLKVDHIDKSIQLFGNLDLTQRNRLMEIADRCPVHRSLNSQFVIQSELESDLVKK